MKPQTIAAALLLFTACSAPGLVEPMDPDAGGPPDVAAPSLDSGASSTDSGPVCSGELGELRRLVIVSELAIRFLEVATFGAEGCPAACELPEGARRSIVAVLGEYYEIHAAEAASTRIRLLGFEGELLGEACGPGPGFEL